MGDRPNGGVGSAITRRSSRRKHVCELLAHFRDHQADREFFVLRSKNACAFSDRDTRCSIMERRSLSSRKIILRLRGSGGCTSPTLPHRFFISTSGRIFEFGSPAILVDMRPGTTTPLACTAAALGAMTALTACTTTAEDKNPCTSNIYVYVQTNPPEGIASTTGSCTPLVCTEPAESSAGCYKWRGNMLPASDGGPASCVVTFRNNGATTSVTFDVSYCSGTNNTEVGSDSVATVTDTGIGKGE
jgi:hypothetical protein